MTDYEHDENGFSDELVSFAKDADLLLYDATYTKEEYQTHKSYGHSYPEKGIEFMDLTGAKRMIYVHHAPDHTDDFLDEVASKLSRDNVSYARAGETILV